jgi:hypothetical protein
VHLPSAGSRQRCQRRHLVSPQRPSAAATGAARQVEGVEALRGAAPSGAFRAAQRAAVFGLVVGPRRLAFSRATGSCSPMR